MTVFQFHYISPCRCLCIHVLQTRAPVVFRDWPGGEETPPPRHPREAHRLHYDHAYLANAGFSVTRSDNIGQIKQTITESTCCQCRSPHARSTTRPAPGNNGHSDVPLSLGHAQNSCTCGVVNVSPPAEGGARWRHRLRV